jgi:hypothetical protein
VQGLPQPPFSLKMHLALKRMKMLPNKDPL